MRILDQIMQCGTQSDLVDLLWNHFRSMGFGAFAYLVPSKEIPLSLAMDWRGLPEEFIERYTKDRLHRVDPFPAHVTRHKTTLRIYEIAEHAKLNRAELDYIERMKKLGVTDGFIIPTFGMDFRIAKFVLCQVDDPSVLENVDLLESIATLQMAHRRFDELSRRDEPIRPRLPRREVEILHWIAQGKTNREIAVILGISVATVATHIKRLFEKLDVNDRAALAVKGIKHGIICA